MYLKNAAPAPPPGAPLLLVPPRELPFIDERTRSEPDTPGGGWVWILFRPLGRGTPAGQASYQALSAPPPLPLLGFSHRTTSARTASHRPVRPHSSERPNPTEAPTSSGAPAAAPFRPTGEPVPQRAEVVPGFLSLVARVQKQLQAAALAEDWPLAERLAYCLKHTASSYGFHQVSEHALRVIHAAAASDPSGLRSAADQLEQYRREAVRLPAHEAAAMMCGRPQAAGGVACAAATRAAGA